MEITTRGPQFLSTRSPRGPVIAGIVVVVTASALAGFAYAAGSRVGVVLSVAAAAGLGLIALAASRFELFVAVILGVRAALDAAKLGGGAPAWLDPAALISLLFLLVGALWLAMASQDAPAPLSLLGRPLLALTLAGGASAIFAADPFSSALDVVRLATVMVLFMVLNRLLVDQRAMRTILWAMFISAIPPLVAAAYQLATGTGFHVSGTFNRVQGTFVHPSPLAFYLTLLIVLGVALLPHVGPKARASLVPLLGACGVLLFLTYTRSAWVATLAGLVTVGLLQSRRLPIALGVLVMVVVLAVPSATARFEDLGQRVHASGQPANSLVWRIEYWRQALQLSDNPLLGVGLGSIPEQTEVQKEPHNDLVRVYVETGVLGLLAYLWFLGSLIVVAREAVRKARPGFPRGVAVGFAGAVVAFLLVSLVSNVITQLVILWYFATLAAAANAVLRGERRTVLVPS